MAVSAVFVSIRLLQDVHIPLPTNDAIQSSALVLGQSPYTAHLAFAIGLLTTFAVTLAITLVHPPEQASARLSVLLFCVVAAIWALNSASCNQGLVFGLGGDPFHEGEYLGFRQNFLKGGLDDCLVIHGPALNILPALVAGPYRDDGYSIAAARLCRSLFGMLALAGYLWVLWELARWYAGEHAGPMFRLLVVGAIACEGIFYVNSRIGVMGPFRDAGFYLPLALLLRWLNATESRPRRDLVRGLLLGLLTAAGPLVSYERGFSWPIVLAFGLLVGAVFRGRSLVWLMIGLMIGGGAIALPLKHDLHVALSQARYWATFGDLIFAIPINVNELRWNAYPIGQLLILFAAVSWVVRDFISRDTGFRDWLRELSPLLILLLVAGLTQRRVLARGDIIHYQLAGMPIVLVLAAWVLLIARRRAAPNNISWLASAALQTNKTSIMIMVAALLVLARPNCSPIAALQYVSDWEPNRSKVSEPTRDILAGIHRRGSLEPGDFYTLDSAGIWFHLLSTSSPSRFHQLVYAMPESSQKKLVYDLEQHHTRVILDQPEGWKFDGVPRDIMFPLVRQYLDDHYTLVEVIHGYRVMVRRN